MGWLKKGSLSVELSVISCACVFVLVLCLWFFMLDSFQDSAVETRRREGQSICSQAGMQSERIAQICNMSTQVYLNTPSLISHLTMLKNGGGMDALELLQFYREDIGSLEKITLSNPDLYQIRVYSVAEDIYEMMPVLYGAERMRRMSWSSEAEGWHLNYADQLFADEGRDAHLMGLVTLIEENGGGRIGVVEVCLEMEKVFPNLFTGPDRGWLMLLSDDGTVIAGVSPVEDMSFLTECESGTICRIDGRRVLVSKEYLEDLSCTYCYVMDLQDMDFSVIKLAVVLFFVMLVVFALLSRLISRLTKRALRGFYAAFDGVRDFAEGNMEAQVQAAGHGEVAHFAKETGDLLQKIRQLMKDNLEQEVEFQKSELRALHNQINAHFIYNIIEAIKMMAEIDEEYEVADALTALGKLLRYSMKWESGNVTLDRELEYIKNYIELMNLRFDYKVELQIDIPQELYGQRLPKISLQPIVENAVVHGAAVLDSDTVITITGRLSGDRKSFTVCIADQGRGMDSEELNSLRRQITGEETSHSSSGNGIGLHNVQERITRVFGESWGLQVESRESVGTAVTVHLPYKDTGKIKMGGMA